jgi:hypothetical protein
MEGMNTRILTKYHGKIHIPMMNYDITGIMQENTLQKWKEVYR